RLGDAAALLGKHRLELVRLEDPAGCDAGPVAVDTGAPDRQQLAFVNRLEQLCARNVDQPHTAADERERTRVRKATRLRVADVDDDPYAGLDELLGRDAVDIRVVDDRDVVR